MAEIISRTGDELTLQVKIKLSGQLMDMEKSILSGCNDLGSLATAEAIKEFDTDGSPLQVGGIKLTARVKDNKIYQTPYGAVDVKR